MLGERDLGGLEPNPDCIRYIVSTSDEPEAVWVSEVWTDEAAHEASLEAADIQALIQEARPLIAGMSDRIQLTVHGGKGLPGYRPACGRLCRWPIRQ